MFVHRKVDSNVNPKIPMKNIFVTVNILILFLVSCQKDAGLYQDNNVHKTSTIDSSLQFVEYVIKKGEQFCNNNKLVNVEYEELSFMVLFDSSAIYKNEQPSNQYDINKLLGFSDNGSHHQQFSARFGWRFSDGALRLFGYVYNEGARSSKEIGVVVPGTANSCSIKVAGDTYIFKLNEKTSKLPRLAKSIKASGYKLYPYFGGDEKAPHDIRIWIKEVK